MPQSIPGGFYASPNSIRRPEAMAWCDVFLHARVETVHFYCLRGYLGWDRPELVKVGSDVSQLALTGRTPAGSRDRLIQCSLHNRLTDEPAEVPGLGIIYRPQ
jgi:hypothetical protein